MAKKKATWLSAEGSNARPPAASVIPPAYARIEDRGIPEFRDIRETEELERWLAEQFRDFQLVVGAETLTQLSTVLDRMLDLARDQRRAVKNDLRQEGYLEGQINVLETVREQVQRAITARLDRIGEGLENVP